MGTKWEALDRERQVHHADVLFDSNVFRAKDDEAERKLHALTELLVAHPDQGNVWFSLMSLSELVAPASPKTRIELLTRFRKLYLRFGDRVRFMRSLDDNIRAECTGSGFPAAIASAAADGDIAKSIAAGDLVGLLKEGHEDWRAEKKKLRERYEEYTKHHQKGYAERAEIRLAFAHSMQNFFSMDGLNQCDDIASRLIASANCSLTLDAVKARHQEYPCVWTFSLLGRLAQYAQTITDDERRRDFPSFQDVLEPHANDFIDADIAGTGARCGMMITNDRNLIAKQNKLYDAKLIRMQGFTVSDALAAYNPPNGRTRAPA
jgi:hypothetical protein